MNTGDSELTRELAGKLQGIPFVNLTDSCSRSTEFRTTKTPGYSTLLIAASTCHCYHEDPWTRSAFWCWREAANNIARKFKVSRFFILRNYDLFLLYPCDDLPLLFEEKAFLVSFSEFSSQTCLDTGIKI